MWMTCSEHLAYAIDNQALVKKLATSLQMNSWCSNWHTDVMVVLEQAMLVSVFEEAKPSLRVSYVVSLMFLSLC